MACSFSIHYYCPITWGRDPTVESTRPHQSQMAAEKLVEGGAPCVVVLLLVGMPVVVVAVAPVAAVVVVAIMVVCIVVLIVPVVMHAISVLVLVVVILRGGVVGQTRAKGVGHRRQCAERRENVHTATATRRPAWANATPHRVGLVWATD